MAHHPARQRQRGVSLMTVRQIRGCAAASTRAKWPDGSWIARPGLPRDRRQPRPWVRCGAGTCRGRGPRPAQRPARGDRLVGRGTSRAGRRRLTLSPWVVADNADPATPRKACRGGQGPLRPPGRRADQRGRIAARDRRGHDRRSVAVRVRERLPRRRPAGPGSRRRSGRHRRRRRGGRLPHRERAARSSSCWPPRCACRSPELAISNGLFPGLAGVVKTLAGELGPGRDPDQRAAARPDRHRPGP